MNQHLVEKTCKPCEGGTPPLDRAQITKLLSEIPHWTLNKNQNFISRTFEFKNYYQTIAFVNAVAWVSHQENHHPDLSVSYKSCVVSYTTHAIGGLSENDFICAAKINAIVKGVSKT